MKTIAKYPKLKNKEVQIRKMVEFLVCGTQKSGTTALHNYLSRHPELYLPAKKELHYFDDESIDWASTNHESYHKHFDINKSQQKKWGEVTPIYMYWNPSAARFWKYNPKMKLIIILRNPITRAYSHWNMERTRNAEDLNFLEAIKTELERSRCSLPLQNRVYSYIDRGFYSQQLRRLYRFFPRNQIFIVKQEELDEHPRQVLSEIYDYLKVSDYKFEDSVKMHSIPYKEPMTIEARRYLLDIFTNEIKQLEVMLNWNCNSWRETI